MDIKKYYEKFEEDLNTELLPVGNRDLKIVILDLHKRLIELEEINKLKI
jgi:hypothetical protein